MFVTMCHFSSAFCTLFENGIGCHNGTTSTLEMEENKENEVKQENRSIWPHSRRSSVGQEILLPTVLKQRSTQQSYMKYVLTLAKMELKGWGCLPQST